MIEQNHRNVNKIITVGLIIISICAAINTALIYTFFNLLKQI